jgi:hypothetical protein
VAATVALLRSHAGSQRRLDRRRLLGSQGCMEVGVAERLVQFHGQQDDEGDGGADNDGRNDHGQHLVRYRADAEATAVEDETGEQHDHARDEVRRLEVVVVLHDPLHHHADEHNRVLQPQPLAHVRVAQPCDVLGVGLEPRGLASAGSAAGATLSE